MIPTTYVDNAIFYLVFGGFVWWVIKLIVIVCMMHYAGFVVDSHVLNKRIKPLSNSLRNLM